MVTVPPIRLDAEDFHSQPVTICGKAFIAQHSGALFWPAEDALIIADLPLGGGQETRSALARLAAVLDQIPASGVIALGSLPPAGRPPADADLACLRILQEGRDWIWVTRSRETSMTAFGGHSANAVTIAGIALRSMPRPGHVTHEIAGGLNPAARVAKPGHTVRRPCFIGNGQRLVLPAFASTRRGLNVLDAAFDPLFGHDGSKVWLLGHEGLYPVATRMLRED